MKKVLVFLCAVLLVFGAVGMASAYQFEDLIDYWPSPIGPIDAVAIIEGAPLSYQHDITDDVDFAAGDSVTQATLELDFTNDLLDGCFFGFSFNEDVYYGFDGSAWNYLGEVDNGQYDISVGVSFLNDNGILNVELAVTNNGWNPGTAWLDHSRLYGEAVSVPEPFTMLLLGLGLVGLAGFQRKLRKS